MEHLVLRHISTYLLLFPLKNVIVGRIYPVGGGEEGGKGGGGGWTDERGDLWLLHTTNKKCDCSIVKRRGEGLTMIINVGCQLDWP